MTSWQRFADEEPALAAAVRARFEATKHHVLATLRRDGSPRVSGTEVRIHGPELTLGSMVGAVKARDLQRDGRFALHANPGDGSMAGGDSKISGRAIEIVDPAELKDYAEATGTPSSDFHLFRLDLTEVVHTSVDEGQEYLLIQVWKPGVPLSRLARYNDGPELVRRLP